MTDDKQRCADDWAPTASIAALRERAQILTKIRQFFAQRNVLEVDTPLLCHASVTDLHLASVQAQLTYPGHANANMYLQTSPEFAMKRLLAAGSGAIYQVCKAFREGERGRRHNPEFTMLEWYRPGFSLSALMDEIEALLAVLGVKKAATRTCYREAFLRHAKLDPFAASDQQLQQLASTCSGLPADELSRDEALDVLITHLVEPNLGVNGPEFIYGYPASQAALAKVQIVDGWAQAQRFELYIQGLELANGYDELVDAQEQAARFEADNVRRRQASVHEVQVDHRLVAALQAGMPSCAGVALGVDRLVMTLLGVNSIDEVIAFPIDRA